MFNGDLQYNVDFRSVYAGLLEALLKTRSALIHLGPKIRGLGIVLKDDLSQLWDAYSVLVDAVAKEPLFDQGDPRIGLDAEFAR
jgi:hypothetical protein